MPILRARSRIISVRLSEDEYSALVNLCESSGARSVSDFARGAMRLLVGNGDNGDQSHVDAKGLQSQILLLSRKLDELNERIKEGYGQGLSARSGNGSASSSQMQFHNPSEEQL